MSQLLLSGATGMVGRELLARAAQDGSFERVFCLVRSSERSSAQVRLDELLGKMGLAPSESIRRTLRLGIVYRPYFELTLRFDTTFADRFLRETAVSCPRVIDYIDTIIDKAVASDFGSKLLP